MNENDIKIHVSCGQKTTKFAKAANEENSEQFEMELEVVIFFCFAYIIIFYDSI